MATGFRILVIGALLLQLGLLAGCLYRERVPHLASDVCLIAPERTSMNDVLAYMGQPAYTSRGPEGTETWIYYQIEKSLLRKLPYIGPEMGYENYEVVIVSLVGQTVRTCVYRHVTEEEFKRIVIEHGDQPGK